MLIAKDTRVYIAGCGGMLGEAVYQRFLATGATILASDIELSEPWLEYADVRQSAQITDHVKRFQPNLIINLAAMTDLEICERNPENAWNSNAIGAENLGTLATQLKVPYAYISTAGIFDGQQAVYADNDTPNPLSAYVKSKFQGEQFVHQFVPVHLILRAGWMMGGGPTKDKKFINKLYKQLMAGSRHLRVVDDKLGTPTYTVDFANGMVKLIEGDHFGLYNQVCSGTASRYDVALEFVSLLGLSSVIEIEKVASDYFGDEYFAPRPASEQLVNLRLNELGLNFMRDWRECLAEYAAQFPVTVKNT